MPIKKYMNLNIYFQQFLVFLNGYKYFSVVKFEIKKIPNPFIFLFILFSSNLSAPQLICELRLYSALFLNLHNYNFIIIPSQFLFTTSPAPTRHLRELLCPRSGMLAAPSH